MDLFGFDDDDSVDEARQEYYYDLLTRSPDVEDVLTQLSDSRTMAYWKEKSKSRKLTNSQIDSVLDPKIVDWHDFHMRYLKSICNNRGTTEKNSMERSHDQIDVLFSLADEMQHAHPDFVAGACQHTKNQWQSMVDVMINEYQRAVNLQLTRGEHPDLPTKVRGILGQPWTPKDNAHAETIYYVTGAVMRTIKNMSQRSKDIYTDALKDIITNSSSTKSNAKSASLPSGKVEKREKHSLCYANGQFYAFMTRSESVFDTLLSEGNIALYGEDIVADITSALCKEDIGFSAFLSQQYDDEIVSVILRRILWSYGRLRGKDFVRKCNAKEGATYHETHRSGLGTRAAIASEKAKEGKKVKAKGGKTAKSGKDASDDSTENQSTEEDKSPRYQYLIKRKKKDLVSMCKIRKLHYSGTKKVLVGRIIEKEESDAANAKTNLADNDDEQSNTVVTAIAVVDADEYDEQVIDAMEQYEMELIEHFEASD